MRQLVNGREPSTHHRDDNARFGHHADDGGMCFGSDAPDVKVGYPCVPVRLDQPAYFIGDVIVGRSSRTAAVSRIRPHDHRAITTAPTMPMTGSIHVQPR